jgi:hypothetical protein
MSIYLHFVALGTAVQVRTFTNKKPRIAPGQGLGCRRSIVGALMIGRLVKSTKWRERMPGIPTSTT